MSTYYTLACAQCGSHLEGSRFRDSSAAILACEQAPLLVHAYRARVEVVFGTQVDMEWLDAHADHSLYVLSEHALPAGAP